MTPRSEPLDPKSPRPKAPRIAVRAVIVQDGHLLLVNAWPDGVSDLLCAPGGGVEANASMPDNLVREVKEETGLQISVGDICLVNEFHDPERGFHQVEVFFRCDVLSGQIDPDWRDPEDIVTQRHWVSPEQMAGLFWRPRSLMAVAFGGDAGVSYDPLERVVR